MSIASKAASGFLWTAASSLGARVITIGSTFVLTRFLTPEVQGEVNVATVCVSTLGWASSFGVGQYITSHPKAGRDAAFHGALLMLGSGLAMAALCMLLRDAAGGWFNAPGMVRYVPGLVVSQLIDRFASLPRGVLMRDLRFRTAGARVALGELAFAVSSVALAARGWGGDAIVGANLVRAVFGMAFLAWVTNWRDYLEPAPLKAATFRSIVRFGLPIGLSYPLHYGATSWDNLFISNRFGQAATGLYNQAYRLADMPATNVGEPINDVLVPNLAHIDDVEGRRRGLRRAAGLMALVVFPMAAGLGAIAPTLVAFFYPPTYQGVAVYLAVLAPFSTARALALLIAGYMQVLGKTRSFVVLDLILVASLLGSMYLLAPFGPAAAALGATIGYTVNLLTLLWVVRPEGIRFVDVGVAVRPLLACAPLALAVLGVRHALADAGLPALVRLLLEVSAGAVVYVAAAFVIAPTTSRDFLALARGVIQRRRGRSSTVPPPAPTSTPSPASEQEPASAASASSPAPVSTPEPTSTSPASAAPASAAPASVAPASASPVSAAPASVPLAGATAVGAGEGPASTPAPVSTPPASVPPASTAPASTPPASAPPASTPPASAPPASTPPASAPPASTPPASAPPASTPPASAPPASEPPSSSKPASAKPPSKPPASS